VRQFDPTVEVESPSRHWPKKACPSRELARSGIELLQVKTLSASRADEDCEKRNSQDLWIGVSRDLLITTL
jgi:hypothetical protein